MQEYSEEIQDIKNKKALAEVEYNNLEEISEIFEEYEDYKTLLTQDEVEQLEEYAKDIAKDGKSDKNIQSILDEIETKKDIQDLTHALEDLSKDNEDLKSILDTAESLIHDKSATPKELDTIKESLEEIYDMAKDYSNNNKNTDNKYPQLTGGIKAADMEKLNDAIDMFGKNEEIDNLTNEYKEINDAKENFLNAKNGLPEIVNKFLNSIEDKNKRAVFEALFDDYYQYLDSCTQAFDKDLIENATIEIENLENALENYQTTRAGMFDEQIETNQETSTKIDDVNQEKVVFGKNGSTDDEEARILLFLISH